MRLKKTAAALFVILTFSAAAAYAETIAIVGGTVVIGDGTVLENGIVIISEDKIAEVGVDIDIPEGARRIDASGMIVWPGMVEPYTTLGLVEVGADRSVNDAHENTATNTADIRASDGIDPEASAIAVTRNNGITTALVSPGHSNPINGQAALIELEGKTIHAMLLADSTALVLSFSSRKQEGYPSTRPGNVAFIRQTLYDTRAYLESKKGKDEEAEEKSNDNNGKIDLKKEALAKALKREIPVIAAADGMQEIASALSVAEEFGLRMILLSPREGWKMTEQIRKTGVPVLLGNTFDRAGERDRYDRYYRYAATLHEAGIPFAFTNGSSHNVRNLPYAASMSVTFGLPYEEAVKALTMNPAKILGIDNTHGTLEPGKVANVVVWDGDPLQITSHVKNLFIRGKEIRLYSNQERLRDLYEDKE